MDSDSDDELGRGPENVSKESPGDALLRRIMGDAHLERYQTNEYLVDEVARAFDTIKSQVRIINYNAHWAERMVNEAEDRGHKLSGNLRFKGNTFNRAPDPVTGVRPEAFDLTRSHPVALLFDDHHKIFKVITTVGAHSRTEDLLSILNNKTKPGVDATDRQGHSTFNRDVEALGCINGHVRPMSDISYLDGNGGMVRGGKYIGITEKFEAQHKERHGTEPLTDVVRYEIRITAPKNIQNLSVKHWMTANESLISDTDDREMELDQILQEIRLVVSFRELILARENPAWDESVIDLGLLEPNWGLPLGTMGTLRGLFMSYYVPLVERLVGTLRLEMVQNVPSQEIKDSYNLIMTILSAFPERVMKRKGYVNSGDIERIQVNYDARKHPWEEDVPRYDDANFHLPKAGGDVEMRDAEKRRRSSGGQGLSSESPPKRVRTEADEEKWVEVMGSEDVGAAFGGQLSRRVRQ
jgi:hypothetical protein